MISPPGDGLNARWDGSIWMNPPYGNKIGRWMGRLAEHGQGVALVFARTETDWFVRHVWGQASAILFLASRVHFCRPDGKIGGSAGAPSVLIAYGESAAQSLATIKMPGTFVSGWRTVE